MAPFSAQITMHGGSSRVKEQIASEERRRTSRRQPRMRPGIAKRQWRRHSLIPLLCVILGSSVPTDVLSSERRRFR